MTSRDPLRAGGVEHVWRRLLCSVYDCYFLVLYYMYCISRIGVHLLLRVFVVSLEMFVFFYHLTRVCGLSVTSRGCVTVTAGPSPNPPSNVSVWQTREGVHIAWQPPTYSPVTVHQYVIEYRTVGQWVPLNEPQDAENSEYIWKTVSRGAEYKFRLRSRSSTGAESEPTRVVSLTTTGTTTAFFCRSLVHQCSALATIIVSLCVVM